MKDNLIHILSQSERLDSQCYFCGEKRSVKYKIVIDESIGDQLIEKEVPCCNRCALLHTWGNDILN